MPPTAQTEFAAFLARADISQAAFARLTGMTPRQVNNWARGRATAPTWAAILAVLLRDHSPEALTIAVEEARQEVAAADPEPPARSAQTWAPPLPRSSSGPVRGSTSRLVRQARR
jgi:transcriptional regulator with XRE-family HTH domain